MMNKLLSILTLVIAISFISCETDIDVNGEYKDITVVYGIINPNDTNHYIKINKAFLGEGNAFDLAADESNFNYEADELTVTVEEYSPLGDLVNNHTITRTVNEIPKDEGIFDNTNNVLYKFTTTFDHSGAPSDRNNTFRLKIFNSTENKEIVGETEITKKITVSNPPNTNGKFQFWIGPVSTGAANDKSIGITTGADVGKVEAIWTFYDHFTTASGLPSIPRSVVMPLGKKSATTVVGQEPMEWELTGETFFDNIVNAVPVPSNVPNLSHRELDNISLQFNIAGTELATYMDVEAPSNTVNQEKPNYTNLSDALGIFSSREIIMWQSSIDPQTQNQVNIQNETITYLQSLNLDFCFGTTGQGFPVAPCVQQ